MEIAPISPEQWLLAASRRSHPEPTIPPPEGAPQHHLHHRIPLPPSPQKHLPISPSRPKHNPDPAPPAVRRALPRPSANNLRRTMSAQITEEKEREDLEKEIKRAVRDARRKDKRQKEALATLEKDIRASIGGRRGTTHVVASSGQTQIDADFAEAPPPTTTTTTAGFPQSTTPIVPKIASRPIERITPNIKAALAGQLAPAEQTILTPALASSARKASKVVKNGDVGTPRLMGRTETARRGREMDRLMESAGKKALKEMKNPYMDLATDELVKRIMVAAGVTLENSKWKKG